MSLPSRDPNVPSTASLAGHFLLREGHDFAPFARNPVTTETEQGSDQIHQPEPSTCYDTSRGGGIRTHGLFVPNEARYQAAPHPA
jgi:hypothetical protein